MVTMPKTISLRDRILAERDNGNVVFMGLPDQVMCTKLDDFVEQPVDGILYDLNRSEEVVITFVDDRKWVNDFAVTLTIRRLVEQRDEARAALIEQRMAGKRLMLRRPKGEAQ